jgi:hypothetical protein
MVKKSTLSIQKLTITLFSQYLSILDVHIPTSPPPNPETVCICKHNYSCMDTCSWISTKLETMEVHPLPMYMTAYYSCLKYLRGDNSTVAYNGQFRWSTSYRLIFLIHLYRYLLHMNIQKELLLNSENNIWCITLT